MTTSERRVRRSSTESGHCPEDHQGRRHVAWLVERPPQDEAHAMPAACEVNNEDAGDQRKADRGVRCEPRQPLKHPGGLRSRQFFGCHTLTDLISREPEQPPWPALKTARFAMRYMSCCGTPVVVVMTWWPS